MSARFTRLTSKVAELTTSLAALTPGTDEHCRTDEELTEAQSRCRRLEASRAVEVAHKAQMLAETARQQ